MQRKKLIAASVAGVIGTVVMGGLLLAPLAVSAATITNGQTTFIQKLAAKLGISESTVQTAVTSVRDEMKTERDAQIQTEINTAVTTGKLSQRQADLLNAEMKYGEEVKNSLTPPTPDSSLTQEQRKVKMEEFRNQMESALVQKLNDNGLNTTANELKAAREAARSAGIMGLGGKGMGMGRGGMMF